MSAKQPGAQKRTPERTCIACRTTAGKRELVRLVRFSDGRVEVDSTSRAPGRGAYLHAEPACWEKALKRGTISHALKTSLTAEDAALLRAYGAALPGREAPTA